MKKILVLTLVFVMLSLSAYAGNAEIQFNPQDFSVKIWAETSQKTDEVLTISLWQGTDEIPGDKTAQFAGLYMTENGVIDETILLPYTIGSGKNTICIDSLSLKENFSVLMLNPSDAATVDAAKDASDIKDSDAMYDFLVNEQKGLLLGIDIEDEKLLSSMPEICDLLVNETKAQQTDDAMAFYNAFCASHGLYLIKNGSDADEVFKKYGQYMGVDYEEYTSLSDEIKLGITELMKKTDTSDVSISSAYKNSALLASVSLSDNLDAFIDKIEENSTALGVDMSAGSDFSKTEESLRYKIFVNMFEIRGDFLSLKDVGDAFDDFVDDILASSSSASSGPSSGGGSSSGKKVSTTGVSSVPYSPDTNLPATESGNQTPKTMFSDISGHYSESCVNQLVAENIINGYADGTFKPDNFVTRAEFSKIIATALKLKANSSAQIFADVLPGAWHYDAISAMNSQGFITGYNGVFAPDDYLTRQDAAVIAVRILKYLGMENLVSSSDFADAYEISDYASDSVSAVAGSGIMTGDNSLFRPRDCIKRGEAAVVVSRIMNISDR